MNHRLGPPLFPHGKGVRFRTAERATRRHVKADKSSALEREFEGKWRMLGGPTLIGEYRFCTGRKWRFDFALVGLKIALEVEGGVWSGGRHTRGAGYESDCEKYNAATAMGWRVLRFTAKMLQGEGWSERMKDAIAWTLEQRSRYAPCRVEEVTR